MTVYKTGKNYRVSMQACIISLIYSCARCGGTYIKFGGVCFVTMSQIIIIRLLCVAVAVLLYPFFIFTQRKST